MARILAYTSPARGHLYPLTSILDELARRGHDIAGRTLASEVALMNERGFAGKGSHAHRPGARQSVRRSRPGLPVGTGP